MGLAGSDAGAGDAVGGVSIFLPLVDWELFGVGVPLLARSTSVRHFLTISLARVATLRSGCCFDRLTTTPIFVERSRSSVGLIPNFSSLSILMICADGSPAAVAFWSTRDRSTTSLASMMTDVVEIEVREILGSTGTCAAA